MYTLDTNHFFALFGVARVVMTNNSAAHQGGAMYVEDTNPSLHCLPYDFRETLVQDNIDSSYDCFFKPNYYSIWTIQITFDSNSAQEAGSALYGGSVDNCKLINDPLYSDINQIPSGVVSVESSFLHKILQQIYQLYHRIHSRYVFAKTIIQTVRFLLLSIRYTQVRR